LSTEIHVASKGCTHEVSQKLLEKLEAYSYTVKAITLHYSVGLSFIRFSTTW